MSSVSDQSATDVRPMGGSFEDQKRVDAYVAQGPRVFLPGFEILQVLMRQLMRERLGDDAAILCLGAGGGTEIATLREGRPGWTFLGVDPSAEMNHAAEVLLGDDPNVTLQTGLIFDAPHETKKGGPFDGATFMLALHFIPDDGGKLDTLKALHSRLKPGAPLFLANHCNDKTASDSELWFDRQNAFALANGLDPDYAREQRKRFTTSLKSVSPARDEDLMAEAGFSDIRLVFAALSWRGWLAHA